MEHTHTVVIVVAAVVIVCSMYLPIVTIVTIRTPASLDEPHDHMRSSVTKC